MIFSELKRISLFFVALALSTPVYSETIIYSDFFNGSSANGLINTAPDIRSGTLGGSATSTWSGANDAVFRADGSVNGNMGFLFDAYLPFSPQAGLIYTFSADVNTTSGSDGDWISLAFFRTGFYPPDAQLLPYPRLLLRDSADRGSDGGQYSADPVNFPFTSFNAGQGTEHLEIVLNTLAPQWTVQFFQNSSSLDGPLTYATNPEIAYVGFEQLLTASGTIDNFSLTATSPNNPAVPLPASLALLLSGTPGLAGIGWFLRRKQNKAEQV